MAVSIVTGAGAVGVLLQPDIAMTEGSVFAFDFSDVRCWPTQANAPDGTTFANLLDGGSVATVNSSGYTMVFNTDGFRFSVGSTAQTIDLPTAANMAGATDGFAVSCWISAETQTQAAKARVAGYFDPSDNTGPWGIYGQSNTLYFVVNSQLVYSATPTALGLGDMHQCLLAWVNAGTVDDPDWRARVYIDGALAADLPATHDTLQSPTDATTPKIGDMHGVEGTSGYWVGKFCRALGWELTGGTDELDDIVALDFDEHSFADPA